MRVHLRLVGERDAWGHPKGTVGRGNKRGKTVGVRRLRLVTQGETVPPTYWRPRTRGDCAQVERPCPFVGCGQNLYLDVTDAGSLSLNFPDVAPHEMPAGGSCALDLADNDGMSMDEVAVTLQISRQRVQQIEAAALRKLANSAKARRVVG